MLNLWELVDCKCKSELRMKGPDELFERTWRRFEKDQTAEWLPSEKGKKAKEISDGCLMIWIVIIHKPHCLLMPLFPQMNQWISVSSPWFNRSTHLSDGPSPPSPHSSLIFETSSPASIKSQRQCSGRFQHFFEFGFFHLIPQSLYRLFRW